jgi:hypothetical protein
VPSPRTFRSRAVAALLLPALGYLGAYSLNSALGGYWTRPEPAPGGGAHRSMAVLWQPRIGHQAGNLRDFWGMVFSPLIGWDRDWVHPSHYLIDDGFDAWFQGLRASQVHPALRGEFSAARAGRRG